VKASNPNGPSWARPRHASSTVLQLLAASVRNHSAAVAILAPGRESLTYAALGRQLETTARSLANAGYGRGSRIGIALPEGPEFAVALLAVCSAATCAPLNDKLDEDALEHLFVAMRIDALIVPEGADSAAVRAARRLAIPLMNLRFSQQDCAGVFELIAQQQRDPVPVRPPDCDNIAFLAHTSGTTSMPKIVPFEHWRTAEFARNRVEQWQISGADRCLLLTPLYSRSTIGRSLLAPLLVGGSVVCPAAFDGKALADLLETLAPTQYFAAPVMQVALLEEFERRAQRPKHSLRLINCGIGQLASPVRSRLEQAFGVPVILSYGMTETGSIAHTPFPPEVAPAGSVGRPTTVEVAIADAAGRILGHDESGEIVVRGPEVFGGYENNDEANRAAFRDGWFRTGDAGRIDREGFVFLVGRIKDMINRGGAKITPGEVEAALAQHPQVIEAAVFAIPHPTLGEDLGAAVVLRDRGNVTERELRRFARAHLAAFKVPTRIIAVPELPRGSLGKVNRAEVAKIAQRLAPTAFVPPADRDEAEIARIFAEVLAVPSVGRMDNFFDLGGDSLRGMAVLVSVDAAFGVSATFDLLLDRPCVAEFAAGIRTLLHERKRDS
jgi:acyl-CoA synthetase (AMP-forming)/AMP-acid ligase II